MGFGKSGTPSPAACAPCMRIAHFLPSLAPASAQLHTDLQGNEGSALQSESLTHHDHAEVLCSTARLKISVRSKERLKQFEVHI